MGRRLAIFLLTLIALNTVAVVVGSVDWIEKRWATELQAFEIFSVGTFTIDYLSRIYSCVADSRFSRPIVDRVRCVVRPMALIDLAAVLPFYLPFVGLDLRFVRMFRLFRVFRVAKLGRYSTA